MEVESTETRVLADGKKFIDVMMRRAGGPLQQQPLSVPHFDEDDESSSSDSDGDDNGLNYPSSPLVRKNDNRFNENNNEEEEYESKAAVQSGKQRHYQGDFQWDNVQDIQQLTNENARLIAQCAELAQQVKTFQIQLEALAPVPGLNAEAIQGILLDKDAAEHDIRDVKIVHQAKLLRQLKRSMQRDKQLAVDAVKQCKQLEAENQRLEKDVETLTLKLQRFQARAAAATSIQQDEQDKQQSSIQPIESNFKKKYDELKAKHDKLQQELKKTQRALVREVGEDVSLDEIVDSANESNTKRGRAQQIVMLKAKIKKLEAKVAAQLPSEQLSQPLLDVDQRAQQEIGAQQLQRQQQLTKVIQERDNFGEKLNQLTKKFDAVKSRVQILEQEKQDTKAKFQVLVDKSKTDDALIDALQRQLETWKAKIQEVKRVRTAESGNQNQKNEERMEIERLRSIVTEYKRQNKGGGANGMPNIERIPTPSSTNSHSITLGSIGMPVQNEITQYRSLVAEKERLAEVVKELQSQLEERDKQLCTYQQRQTVQSIPLMPPALNDSLSRIPRKPMMSIIPTRNGSTTNQSIPPLRSNATNAGTQEEVETLRRTFRQSLEEKEMQITALMEQVRKYEDEQQKLTPCTPQIKAAERPTDDILAQEVQDLQEENDFLRQEFDKLKTRYEALVLNNKNKSKS